MNRFDLKEHPHRRYNPLNDTWVLVSPHRSKRPWQGQVEKHTLDEKPKYDADCYLCPGNKRARGGVNPLYKGTYSFTNDFSAVLKDIPDGRFEKGDIFKAEVQKGVCKVICFSPRHDLTIPEMETTEIRKVVDLWVDEYQELGARKLINYVQIFENKGTIMGCSNPHPHGQIWSTSVVPLEPARKTENQLKYYKGHKKSLLADYLEMELEDKVRIVVENDHFVALVPFWAVWPYETMVISKRHVQHIGQFTESEKDSLAGIYKKITVSYDNLFETSFPYSAGIHQCPTDGSDHESWHFHMSFYPPLLRSATVKKFMVGYELLADPQRDITPEFSAQRLKEVSGVHYKKGNFHS